MPAAPDLLSLRRVAKNYGPHVAVRDVSLEIAPGRFVTLLGPSGSGKTTLLMMIAGFVTPSAGSIHLGERDITQLAPEKRDFGMVFQGYALFPHLTVAENIAFPLRLRKVPAATIGREVERMLELVQLPSLGGRLPRQLSGGQQQRVALARALVFKPKLLLLDEPLSALDKKLRAGLQEELRELHQRLGTTFIFVTHDQDEALSMSDEVVVVNHGRIVQQGTPKTLYQQPASHFVADFLGRSNFISTRATGFAHGVATLATQAAPLRQAMVNAPAQGAPVLLALRPEKIALSAEEPTHAANRLVGTVHSAAYQGAETHVRVDTALGSMQVVVASWLTTMEPQPGASVWLAWAEDAAVVVQDDRAAG
jgi:spermidine/putrescine ABC transporter ATP-binding subunit